MKTTKIFLTVLSMLFLVRCGSTSHSFSQMEILRTPTDTPANFESPEPFSQERVCHSPLLDPRDGTRISFIRSSWPLGDYEVPSGRYGVQASELLRVNCQSGAAVGIVKR